MIQFSLAQLSQLNKEQVLATLRGIDRKTWIKIGAGAVVAGVVFFLLVRPAWFLRPAVVREIKATREKIIEVETLRRKKPEWARDKESYRVFLEAVHKQLYRPEDMSLLLGTISRLAQESGVSIIASRPEKEVVVLTPPFHLQYGAERIQLTAEGGYHAMGQFISRIESNPQILRIELFDLLPRADSPAIHQANITLAAITYQPGQAVAQALTEQAAEVSAKDKGKKKKKDIPSKDAKKGAKKK